MDAVSISKTSVNFYNTIRLNMPEDGHVHACNSENVNESSRRWYLYGPRVNYCIIL